ncbi:MAG: prolipoprotein diacylglyceryl transferase [Mycoplasmataceae bacterium]|nr:prolipoprotein diacylglyceryl transferase [Mycoplasmataceae bacterium]
MDISNVEINQPIKSNSHAFQKKDYLTWLIISLSIIIVVPTLMFVLVSTLGRGNPLDDHSVAFHIGSLSVAWYGIMIFFGFVSAIALGIIKLWKLYKCPIDPFYWFCLMGIPAAILGARIWSCVLGANHGGIAWSDFFNFRGGGLAIEGGVVFTVIVACIWFPFILKRPSYQIRDLGVEPNMVRQVSMWMYVDAIVPAILIGQVLGRYGNYMNQELHGSAMTGSWANFISYLFPYMKIDGEICRPLFFYESFFNWWGLILIYVIGEFIPKKKAGDLGMAYFLWYGILRTILEPYRTDGSHSIVNTVFSIVWIVVAVILIPANHLWFWRLRIFRVKYIIFHGTALKMQIKSNASKIQRLSKPIKNYSPEEANEIKTKLDLAQANKRQLDDKWAEYQSHRVRRPNEMLYYLGR